MNEHFKNITEPDLVKNSIKPHYYKIATGAALILIAIVAFYFIFIKSSLTDYLIQYGTILKIYSEDNLLVSVLLFSILMTSIVALALPLTAVGLIISGYLYGLYALPLTLVCLTIGALAPYAVAGYATNSLLRRKALLYIEQAQEFFDKNQLIYCTCLRMIPGIPFPVTSAIAGVMNVKPPIYMLTTFIGTIPGCLTLTLIGQQIDNLSKQDKLFSMSVFMQPDFLITTLLVLIVFVIPMIIVNKYHRNVISNHNMENK